MQIDNFVPHDEALDRIYEEIQEIEAKNGVRVLFAVESGSRSWRFASSDSDYDVRFVYKRPMHDYLRLDKRSETIDWHPEPLYDMVGWDVSKFLKLLRKSNPSAIEWLHCPRYVINDPLRMSALEELGTRCMNPRALAFHYVGMARENANEFLRIANGEVRLTQRPKTKKYVYVVRALLAARYLSDFGEVPPIQFDELLDTYCHQLDDEGVLTHVESLMARKREGLETDVHERIPDLDVWVMTNIADCTLKAGRIGPREPVGWDEVNEMLIRVLTT